MAQMQACLPAPHSTDASAGATIRAMSGSDPRLPWKSATDPGNQLERRRLAAEREDAQQEQLELLLGMASKTSGVLAESVTYDASRDMFTNKDATLEREGSASPADVSATEPAPPDDDDNASNAQTETTVVPVRKTIGKRKPVAASIKPSKSTPKLRETKVETDKAGNAS